jgi:aspartate ammonia-lyase
MDREKLHLFIQQIELFKGLTEEELQQVVDHAQEHVMEAGTSLFRENHTREKIFMIYEGEVELYKTTAYGQEKRLCIFNRMDFLGEGSLMDDAPHATRPGPSAR